MFNANYIIKKLHLLGLKTNKKIAIAVSGGSDSMFLSYLLKDTKGFDITALIVDHGIRNESGKEASLVKKKLEEMCYKVVILKNEKKIQNKSIQDKARDIRYKLLEHYCLNNDINSIVLAHHKDDQIETIAIRKRAKSSLIGLAGMAEVYDKGFVKLYRPILDLEKKDILNFCYKNKVFFVEDPSNENDIFERVRLRKKLSTIEKNKLIDLGKKACVHRNNLCENFKNQIDENIFFSSGISVFRNKILNHENIGFFLREIVLNIGSRKYPPRKNKIMNLVKFLKNDNLKMLSSGCVFEKKSGMVWVYREYSSLINSNYIKYLNSYESIYDKYILLNFNGTYKNIKIAPIKYIGKKVVKNYFYENFKIDIFDLIKNYLLSSLAIEEIKIPNSVLASIPMFYKESSDNKESDILLGIYGIELNLIKTKDIKSNFIDEINSFQEAIKTKEIKIKNINIKKKYDCPFSNGL